MRWFPICRWSTAARDNHDTLARLTGTSYSDLDKQYRQFLQGKRGQEPATSGTSPADPPTSGEGKR